MIWMVNKCDLSSLSLQYDMQYYFISDLAVYWTVLYNVKIAETNRDEKYDYAMNLSASCWNDMIQQAWYLFMLCLCQFIHEMERIILFVIYDYYFLIFA